MAAETARVAEATKEATRAEAARVAEATVGLSFVGRFANVAICDGPSGCGVGVGTLTIGLRLYQSPGKRIIIGVTLDRERSRWGLVVSGPPTPMEWGPAP